MAWNETTQEQYRRPMATNETDLTDGEWALIDTRLMWPAERAEPGHDPSRTVTRPLVSLPE